jgi:AmmeMemoRadiSam system protein A
MEYELNPKEKQILLMIARQSIEKAVKKEDPINIILSELPPKLREQGASFVTLTIHGRLRGCIGTLEAYQPLVLDVCEHAVAAATQDYRFPPLNLNEFDQIEIEISRLTPQQKLVYETPTDLIAGLHPQVDGVVLRDGFQRATFLPQVWEKLSDPAEFLSQLCLKMGAPANLWRSKKLEVFTYQVEEFKEE